jgi:hypothetical protein
MVAIAIGYYYYFVVENYNYSPVVVQDLEFVFVD